MLVAGKEIKVACSRFFIPDSEFRNVTLEIADLLTGKPKWVSWRGCASTCTPLIRTDFPSHRKTGEGTGKHSKHIAEAIGN